MQEKAERQLALYEQFKGPHHPNIASALGNWALSLEGQGKLSEAQSMHERAFSIHERVHGPHHPEVATYLSDLGALYLAQQDHHRAKSAFERALAIQEHAFGPQHLDVAATLCFLGDCHRAAVDLAQSNALFERSLSIIQTQLGRMHPSTAGILQRLASLATIAGRPRPAAALTERAAVAAVTAMHQPFRWCGKMDVHASKKCGRCQAMWFCNEECQLQAWPEHKQHCHKKPVAPVAASAKAASAAK